MSLPAEQIGSAYSCHAKDLRRFLRSRVGCAATADDLAQDVFVRLFNTTAGSGDIGDVRSYLFRVAHNLVIDHHRWVNRKTAPRELVDLGTLDCDEFDIPSLEPSAEDLLALDDEVRTLEHSMRRLSHTCREIFWLSRGFGFRNNEIATMLGVCVSTVEKNLSRALRCCQEDAQAA